MAHLNEMPWAEPLLTEQIEKTLYKGMHMTFCKKRDDSWGVVSNLSCLFVFTTLFHHSLSAIGTRGAGNRYIDLFLICHLVVRPIWFVPNAHS